MTTECRNLTKIILKTGRNWMALQKPELNKMVLGAGTKQDGTIGRNDIHGTGAGRNWMALKAGTEQDDTWSRNEEGWR